MVRAVGIIALFFAVGAMAFADTTTVESTVAEVHLCKNGLAAIRRTVDVPGPGTYRLDGLPAPVHGTFWVTGPAPIAARASTEDVQVPFKERSSIDLQNELGGKQVTLYFRDGTIAPVTGMVVEAKPIADAGAGPLPVLSPQGLSGSPGRFLVMKVGADRIYVDTSMIAYANVRDAGDTIAETRPVLVLEVGTGESGPLTVEISYLAHGLSWAPGYRVDLSNPTTLSIRQQAVIKNELEDLDNADVYLISGFPGIEFAHVQSPLTSQVSWNQFFQQLQQRPNRGHNATMQQAVLSNNSVFASDMSLGLSAIPSGDGPDMHYQPVGAQTLDRGDSLLLDVASASTEYRRLVAWVVPDTRDADGRLLRDPYRQPEPTDDDDDPWDVVEFKNPFDFPMTTAPALMVADHRVLGQNMSYWANRGETTHLRITKALSIRTSSEEHEVAGTREQVVVGGRDYQRTAVEGTLRVNNHRAESVDLVVRRKFSGELLDASGESESRLLEEGAWSVNRRNEVVWKHTLAPGAEETLTYRYTVLVVQ